VDPGKSCTGDTKPTGQTIKEYLMVNRVKCCGKIEKAETSDFLVTHGLNKMIVQ